MGRRRLKRDPNKLVRTRHKTNINFHRGSKRPNRARPQGVPGGPDNFQRAGPSRHRAWVVGEKPRGCS
eukprot:8880641-Pyramimonas_sp.AAC.1